MAIAATAHDAFEAPDKLTNTASSLQRAEIESLAHWLWEERGCPEGSPEIDWFEAERLLQFRATHAAKES